MHVLLRFEGNARGMLWASQVAVGCENGLQLRVYGDKAWSSRRQDNPNQMWFTEFGRPKQLLTRGGAISGDAPPDSGSTAERAPRRLSVAFVGGLVGFNFGTITSSYATGSVSGLGLANLGGLVGHNGGTISSAYATGAVSGSRYVGGLVGSNGGTITNTYASGAVTGTDTVGS